MKITVEFYGKLKTEFSQHPIEWISVLFTIEEIYQEICNHHQQTVNTLAIKPIINDTFCDWHQLVQNNDVIGFFPPASGG